MTVNRRTVLAALGTAVASAGCFGQGNPDPGNGPADGNETQTTPTDTTTDTPTDTPPADGPFADVACPSFVDTERTICWHTRTADDPVVLEPGATTYEPDGGTDDVETIDFTLRNQSEQSFGLNPYAWQLHVLENGEWRKVAPDQWIEPWYTVAPGESRQWVLATEEHPTPGGDDIVHVVQDLGSRTYAFSVHGHLGTGGDEPTSVECVALFDVEVATDTATPTTTTATGNRTESHTENGSVSQTESG
jgi:hypothetical protein